MASSEDRSTTGCVTLGVAFVGREALGAI
ncbi:uncharacterized protein G2W53_017748 [Senna tora]|uniref:Uncharacterized protein n=1 Tax=Senna tora TaxID=362788 RepID=A0A834TRS8_9FABA|nr:uncharacterized protein G2W53_017748 [Senna tora]